MPFKKCSSNGKSGAKYGNQKCYTGSGSKAKATKQMNAIRASQAKTKSKYKANNGW